MNNESIKITDVENKELSTDKMSVYESGIDNPEDKALSKDEFAQLIMQKKKEETAVFTQEVMLPSAGYFGGPLKVRIRRMTTAEEKIIYSSRDGNFITDIVKACVVSPVLDLDKISPADIVYLLYAIRNITFGEKYKQETTCPECGQRQTIEVDITDMEIKMLDADYIEECLKVELPDCGKTLKMRLMPEGEIRKLDNKIMKDVVKKNIEDPDGYEFMQKLVALVASIDGEPVEDKIKTEKFLTNLSMRDYNKIRKQSNEAVKSYGLDTSTVFTCKKCKEIQEVTAIIAPEFFRPNE